jgi:hypothetical protein
MVKMKDKPKRKQSGPARIRRRDRAHDPEEVLGRLTPTWSKTMGNPLKQGALASINNGGAR